MNRHLYLDAAHRLHDYLVETHLEGPLLVGPDPVGKIQWRVTRFVRSYAPFLPNDERYVYLQGQAYWIKSNLLLYNMTQQDRYWSYFIQCADAVVARQPANGAWVHPPIRERKGFISTVEGVWASLGLLAAYRASGVTKYLTAADHWYDFQVDSLGFQTVGEGMAPNYYAHSTIAVPNVTTMLLWLAYELYDLTGDQKYLAQTDRMLTFIALSQLPSGELPYIYKKRPHFMCFQYNSYQLLDLAHAYKLQPSDQLYEVLHKLAGFVTAGVQEDGTCRYNCFAETPEVTYWGAAIGNALRTAHELRVGNFLTHSERAYEHLLRCQRTDGSFEFSRHNYRFLRDNRSYPRYLAMILHHILCRVDTQSAQMQIRMGVAVED